MAPTPSCVSPMKLRPKLTIAVEGNIGSGKSTFLKHFGAMHDVTCLMEPIDQWQNVNGHNILHLMYIDPKRWGLMFQHYVQLTMLRVHTTPVQTPVKLMERSVHSARYCFVENLRNSGYLEDVEYQVLDEWYQYIVKTQPVNLDLIVYLRTDPEVAFQRVVSRNRGAERSMKLDYLATLHDLHEAWLSPDGINKSNTPVITLDANKAPEILQRDFGEYLQHSNIREMAAPLMAVV